MTVPERFAQDCAAVDRFEYVAATDPLAQPLFVELAHEYGSRYGDSMGEEPAVELNRYPADAFSRDNGGAFLLVLRGGEPIAGGAFKRFDKRTVELKRIWTSASHRREGLARKVVRELEEEARRQGFERAYLTTGPRQPEAVHLYLSTGYTPLFDASRSADEIIIHGFAKGLDDRTVDLSDIDRANRESLAAFVAAHPGLGVGVR